MYIFPKAFTILGNWLLLRNVIGHLRPGQGVVETGRRWLQSSSLTHEFNFFCTTSAPGLVIRLGKNYSQDQVKKNPLLVRGYVDSCMQIEKMTRGHWDNQLINHDKYSHGKRHGQRTGWKLHFDGNICHRWWLLSAGKNLFSFPKNKIWWVQRKLKEIQPFRSMSSETRHILPQP